MAKTKVLKKRKALNQENAEKGHKRGRLKVNRAQPFCQIQQKETPIISTELGSFHSIPKDVLAHLISFNVYPWMELNKYFRGVSLNLLPLEKKRFVFKLCCERGYLDLLQEILVTK